jgi:hypothetical protein
MGAGMIKIVIGAFVAAVAMFITGFIFFATPLNMLAYSSIPDAQQAGVQAVLAANMPQTGTYSIPSAVSAEGAVMYGKGPVATVHYNSGGFSAEDPMVMIKGFIHMFVVALLVGMALGKLDRRIPDFASRARIVVLFGVAANIFAYLGEPIWYQHDWTYALYQCVAQTVMLVIGGLVIARWFLPVSAIIPNKVQEPRRVEEVSTVDSASL